ncbi:hypothetical protein RCL1_001328 [Eukaryota sp. TZLM3-RCL]
MPNFNIFPVVRPRPTADLFTQTLLPLINTVLEESADATLAVLGTASSGRNAALMAPKDGLVFQLCTYLKSFCSSGKGMATVAAFSLPFKGNTVLDLFDSKKKVNDNDGELEDLLELDVIDDSFSSLLSSCLSSYDPSSADTFTLRFNIASVTSSGEIDGGGSLFIVLLPPLSPSSSNTYSIFSLASLSFARSEVPPWFSQSILIRCLMSSLDPESGCLHILFGLDAAPLEPFLTTQDLSSRDRDQAQKIEKELNHRLSMFEQAAHKEQQKLIEEFSKSKQVYENRIRELKSKITEKQSNDEAAFTEKVSELEAKKIEFDQKMTEFEAKKNEIEGENNDLKADLRKKSAQLQKVEEELARLKKRLESRNEEIKKKDKKIQKLEAEMKKREDELSAQMAAMPSVPDVGEELISNMSTDTDAELARAREELMEERKKREDLEFIVMELRTKLDSKNWLDDEDIEALKNKRNKRTPKTMERVSRDDEEYSTDDYERINGHESTSDLIERVLQYLQHGTLLVKHGRAGKPHLRYFYINKERTRVCWRNVKSEKDADNAKNDHFIQFAEVTRFILGQHTEVFQRQAVINPEDDDKSFSLVLKDGSRTLDVVCETEMEHEAWVLGLSALLNVEPRWGQILDLRPFPEARKLDIGEADLCEKYRIVPEEYMRIKEIVLEETYERGYVTKADIRVVCRIDILRASKIHDFMEGRRWICSRPLYEDDDPLISPYDLSDDEDGWL